MFKLQFGQAHSADFEENTLTFEINGSMEIKAGEVAIIRIDSEDEKANIEEFVKSLKQNP